MKNKDTADTAQSVYLLEYGRRKIKVCADTFQNLAQIFGEEGEGMDAEEEAGARQARAVYLMRKKLTEGRQLFAGNLKEMAEMMNQVAEESVRFISLGSRRQKQIAKGLLSEGLLAKDVYLVLREGHPVRWRMRRIIFPCFWICAWCPQREIRSLSDRRPCAFSSRRSPFIAI